MVYELERVLRVCNGFLCSISVTYDCAVSCLEYLEMFSVFIGILYLNHDLKSYFAFRLGNH